MQFCSHKFRVLHCKVDVEIHYLSTISLKLILHFLLDKDTCMKTQHKVVLGNLILPSPSNPSPTNSSHTNSFLCTFVHIQTRPHFQYSPHTRYCLPWSHEQTIHYKQISSSLSAYTAPRDFFLGFQDMLSQNVVSVLELILFGQLGFNYFFRIL